MRLLFRLEAVRIMELTLITMTIIFLEWTVGQFPPVACLVTRTQLQVVGDRHARIRQDACSGY